MSVTTSYPRSLLPQRLAIVWVLLVLTLVFLRQSTAAVVIICAGLVLSWLAGLAAAAFIGVPDPIASLSALAARAVMAIRWLLGALMLGVTTTYGALVAIEIQRQVDSGDPVDIESLLFEALGVAIVLVPFGCALWVSVDLCRSGPTGRRIAAAKVTHKLEQFRRFAGAQLGEGAAGGFSPVLDRWITDAVEWMISPTRALISAYFSPVIIYFLVTSNLLA